MSILSTVIAGGIPRPYPNEIVTDDIRVTNISTAYVYKDGGDFDGGVEIITDDINVVEGEMRSVYIDLPDTQESNIETNDINISSVDYKYTYKELSGTNYSELETNDIRYYGIYERI